MDSGLHSGDGRIPEEIVGEVEITELRQQFDQLKANY
jgi:hypothetical protein